jgi:hypothetical protein
MPFPERRADLPPRWESRAVRLCPFFATQMLPGSGPRQTVWRGTRVPGSASPALRASPSRPSSGALPTTGSGQSDCRVANPPALDRATHQTALRSPFPTRFRLPSIPPLPGLGLLTFPAEAIAPGLCRSDLPARPPPLSCCVPRGNAAATSYSLRLVKASASLWSWNQTFTGSTPLERRKSASVCAVRLSTRPGTPDQSQPS